MDKNSKKANYKKNNYTKTNSKQLENKKKVNKNSNLEEIKLKKKNGTEKIKTIEIKKETKEEIEQAVEKEEKKLENIEEVTVIKNEKIKNLLKKIKLICLSFSIKVKNIAIKIFNFLKNIWLIIFTNSKRFIVGIKEKIRIKKLANGDKKKEERLLKRKEKRDSIEKYALKEARRLQREENKKLRKERKEAKKARKLAELLENDENSIVLKSITGKRLPTGLNKSDKKRRKTVYLKESLFFTIILTTIDAFLYYNTSYVVILTIFDNVIWNLFVTFGCTLLFLLIGIYILDYILTENIVNYRTKKLKKIKDKEEKRLAKEEEIRLKEEAKKEKEVKKEVKKEKRQEKKKIKDEKKKNKKSHNEKDEVFLKKKKNKQNR